MHNLVMAPQLGNSSNASLDATVSRLRSLIEWVANRGHRAVILFPRSDQAKYRNCRKIGNMLFEFVPEAVEWINIQSKNDLYFTFWPKDGIQDWGEFTASAACGSMYQLAQRLSSRSVVQSRLCEGGLTARCGHHAMVSKSATEDFISSIPSSTRYAFLPFPSASNLFRREQPTHAPLTHLDFDCSLLLSRNGDRVCLVSERYFRIYRYHVETAAEELGFTILQVPQDEVDRRGLNLVNIAEDTIIVPQGCPMLQGMLSELLGSDAVLPVQIDEAFGYNDGYGGLGCMSSVLEA